MTRSITASVVAPLLAAGMVSCSSSGGSNPPSKPPICHSLSSLKSSVNQLTHLNVSTTSVQDVKNKLTTIKNDVQQVANDASSRYSPQVNTIKQDFASLQTGITQAISNPSASSISQISTQVSKLHDGISSLRHELGATC